MSQSFEGPKKYSSEEANIKMEGKKAALEIVRKNGDMLGSISPEFRMDKEVVLEAVRQDGMAILYADPDIGTNNKEMVLEAVRQSGDVLGHVSPEFRMDKEVVLEAVRQNPLAALYAPPELQNDPDIIRAGQRK